MKKPINIIRGKPRKNYTVLRNEIANDERLSARALGMLYYLLTKPPTWDVIPDQVKGRFGLSYRVTLKVLGELAAADYVKRELVYENFRITGIRYLVTDEPGGFAEGEEQQSQGVNFPARGQSSQTAKRHPVVSIDRDKFSPLPPHFGRAETGGDQARQDGQKSHLAKTALTRGRTEVEIAKRIGPNGFDILMQLPEHEVEQLCLRQRRGTLDDVVILRLRAGLRP